MHEQDGLTDSTVAPHLRWIPEVHRAHRDSWLCHEATSGPPALPVEYRRSAADRRLLAAQASDVILTSADGTKYRAHLARAGNGSTDGIVIAPDVRGLHSFYVELADRFAEAGVNAIAFDYFGRSLGTAVPAASFYEGTFQTAPFRAHVDQTKPATIQEDLRAASAHLRKETGARRVFVTGFCFGGRVAFNAAAEQPDVTGVIGFYGSPVQRSPEDVDAPVLRVDRMKAAVMGLFGAADQGIPQEARDAFAKKLAETKVPHKIVAYEGAPHSFFDRHFVEHAVAADDAWKRMLAFIRTGDPSSI